MIFVAGITKFEKIRKEATKQVIAVVVFEEKPCLDDYSFQLLYECQNMSVIDIEDTAFYYTSYTYYPPHHWLTVGYCIANSQCAWNLNFNSAVVDAEMLLQGLQDCKTQPAYTIRTIHWELYRDSNDIEIVSRALNAVPSLKTLNVRGSKFTLHSTQAFAFMLQQSQSLTEVDISNCNIHSDSACCLARALHNITTLTELNISENRVGNEGALAIAEMLKYNTSLTMLNMRGNSLGERGGLAMAEILKHNTTITVLNMNDNSVGERVALAMAIMLEHNTTLEVLHMYDITIGIEGLYALVYSLAVNHHLKKLHVYIPSMRDIRTFQPIVPTRNV